MDDAHRVLQTALLISGRPYEISVFRRSNGKHFALTRFSDCDSVVSDGCSVEDTLRQHSDTLSLAVSCRWQEHREELGH